MMGPLQYRNRELPSEHLTRSCGMASFEFLGCREAALDDVFLHSQNPALVIRSTEISNWRQLFLRKARMVYTPGTGVAHGSLHSEDAPLPLSVEHTLVLFDLDFAEAVRTTYVVHAVHQRIIPHAFVGASAMSALGQKRTSEHVQSM